MQNKCTSRVQCSISLAALQDNFNAIKQYAKSCALMPVLKNNAYGMGVKNIGAALKSFGAARFAAADLNEAIELQELGTVQILGALFPEEMPEAIRAGIICPVCQLSTAEALSQEAVRQNRQVSVAIKLDTGMGRLGFSPEDDLQTIVDLVKLPNLKVDSLFAHFASAGEPDLEYSSWQIERFKNALAKLNAAGISFPNIHHAAGDAVFNIPQATEPPFNMVRPGGVLYGKNFTGHCRQIIRVTAKIAAISTFKAGKSVGYCRTFTVPEDTLIATISAGYADGVPLALSNRGRVLIGGVSCPVRGRVAMDYLMVDVSGVPGAAVGDEVVLLGKQGDEAVTIQEWAEIKGTHSHDIWCSIGPRTRRIICD